LPCDDAQLRTRPPLLSIAPQPPTEDRSRVMYEPRQKLQSQRSVVTAIGASSNDDLRWIRFFFRSDLLVDCTRIKGGDRRSRSFVISPHAKCARGQDADEDVGVPRSQFCSLPPEYGEGGNFGVTGSFVIRPHPALSRRERGEIRALAYPSVLGD
jgi:hypothetical protein